MVNTRSSRKTEQKAAPQPIGQRENEQPVYSAEELAAMAFNHIKEKIRDKLDQPLPDLLLLPDGGGRKGTMDLSSTLDPGMEVEEEEVKGRDRGREISAETIKRQKELMKKSVITPDFEKKESVPPLYVSRYKLKKTRKAERDRTAGKSWFEMPAPEMTEELKNDLKVLQMRETLDRAHHYKKSDWKQLPKYFQVGRVIEGPGEFYSARIPKKQRKRTIVEELMANEDFKRYQKRKYSELQAKKQALLKRRRKKKSLSKHLK